MSVPGDRSSALRRWLRTTDWLWMIVAGFYLVAYLFWYLPALAEFPRSVRDPPEQFPWHWPLDFVVTALTGGALLVLGFARATRLATGSSASEPPRESRPAARSPGSNPGAE